MAGTSIEKVKKMDRKCEKHGVCQHGYQLSGGGRRWICAQCDRERLREQRARKLAGEVMLTPAKPKDETVSAICPGCRLELPKSGICGTCY